MVCDKDLVALTCFYDKAWSETCVLSSFVCIDLLRKKKKVEKENSQLATQVEELKKRLSELEQLRQVNGDSASHQHGTVEEVDNSDAARRVRGYT